MSEENSMLKSGWNQLLIVLGTIGLLFFFYAHPYQFPDTAASHRIDSARALENARSYLMEIGYESFEAEPNTRFYRDNNLSSQLQHQLGRRSFNRLYKTDMKDKLPVMHWSVQQDNIRDLIIGGSQEEVSWDLTMAVTLSPGGKVIGFKTDKPDSLFMNFNPGHFDGSVSYLIRETEGPVDESFFAETGSRQRTENFDENYLSGNLAEPGPDSPMDVNTGTAGPDGAGGLSAGGGPVPADAAGSDTGQASGTEQLSKENTDQEERSSLPSGPVQKDIPGALQNLTPQQFLDKVRFNLDPEQESRNEMYDPVQDQYIIGRDMVMSMVESHLSKTTWNPDQFRVDSMFVIAGRSSKQARILLDSIDPVLDHNIRLNLDIAATGQLLRLEHEAKPVNPREKATGEQLWTDITGIGYFLMGLIAFIVFIRRFTLRLIDSKSALPDTLAGAVILSSVVMISAFNDVTMYGVGETRIIIGMLIGTFFLAAIGGVLFFILSSTSVSISYGLMPEKIRSLNFARSGYMFNAPVGKALLQGFFTAGIILGLYALYLSAFPNAVYSYENNTPFDSYFLFGKSLSVLVSALLIAIFITYSLYLILGSMIYGEKHRITWFFVVTIIVWTLSYPINPDLANPATGFLSAAITGALISIIYLRYDALSVLTAIFAAGFIIPMYESYLVQAPNWQAETGFSAIMLTSLLVAGVAGIRSSKTGDELPSFVPGYIFEHANRQRMKRELEIARQVQLSFLPEKTPEFGSIDMAANCRAASEVGGDYYDFIHLDENRMVVVIGDVSGKGIQAAFYMTLVKGFIQTLSYNTNEPAAFLSKLNFLFCKNVNKGTFVSLIFGVIDTKNETFTFARAGHNPIIYHNQSKGEPVMLNTSGLAIGMVSDDRFENNIGVHTIDLQVGDTLVLYTDGYSEAMDPAKNLYGEEKLMSIIQKNNNRVASDLLDAINKDVNRFAGFADQHDDMTMLIIRYTGEKTGQTEQKPGLLQAVD
jgi:phosphoserine phosphatase RsbU/P